MVQEADGDRSVSAWIFDTYTFAPLATVQQGRLYSVMTDHLGTPMELVGPGRSVAWSRRLTSWGQTSMTTPEPGATCPLGFQGQWYDDESGLLYNRCRYYDPGAALYLSADPLGIVSKLNTYAYAINPVNWIDPLGLADLKWDNPKSTPTWGHTFSQHGAGNANTRDLTGRAGGTGQSQGQWTNNQEAANFLAGQRPGLQPGENVVPIPPGLGQVVRPDGSVVPATHAVLVPNDETGGYRTGYPIDPDDERSKPKEPGCD
jgi:RHS repeat-associated protein